jgi:ABC-type Fe3+/spermidine/putrescine transport system ATPase subunit
MLNVQSITASYGEQVILKDIEFSLEAGQVLCLLGASGSGKTTLLRIIAGLEQPQQGYIHFDGHDIQHTPVHARRFGLMFQEHALFPHLSVEDNIAFGMKMQGVSRQKRSEKIEQLLALVNLPNYGKRNVASLSGGERQRVALARSLAPHPRLLMLDEPLASLDANLRQQLVSDLRHIVDTLQLPTLYVTHDQAEAFALADQIAILQNGRILQMGTPDQIYQQPEHIYVARFLGLTNIFDLEDKRHFSPELTQHIDAPHFLVHPMGIEVTHDEHGLDVELEKVVYQGTQYAMTGITKEGLALRFFTPATTNYQLGHWLKIGIQGHFVIPLVG